MKKVLQYIKTNSVFVVGALLALLTSIYEVSSTGGNPSWWIMGWSGSIAVLTYLGKNLTGQAASIIAVIVSTAVVFFEAHGNPAGLSIKEIGYGVLLPLAIKILGIFYTGKKVPTKTTTDAQGA